MSETFEESIDFYRIWKFHGFNHDMNDAHSHIPHATLIALSQLEDRLDELGENFLGGCKVISPGMLHIGLLEHHMPANMIAASVSTRFEAQPLYVPVKGKSVQVHCEKSEEPFVAEGDGTGGIAYMFKISGPNLFGELAQLQETEVIAFPDSLPTGEIFAQFKKKFERLTAEKAGAIDSSGKDTDITEEHDSFYWASIAPTSAKKGAEPRIRRGASLSQLELLAKLPRVLSIHREKAEKSLPAYVKPVVPTQPYFSYAGLEKSMGMVDDAERRAYQLANMLKYIYARQEAVFNPSIKCNVGDSFNLTTHLVRYKKGFHVFVSELVLASGCAYADKSTILADQLIPEKVMAFLYDRKVNIRTMERFE